MQFTGECFRAGNSQCLLAKVEFVDSDLLIEIGEESLRTPVQTIKVDSPVGKHAPYIFYLPDHTMIKIPASSLFREQLQQREQNAGAIWLGIKERKSLLPLLMVLSFPLLWLLVVKLLIPTMTHLVVISLPTETVVRLDDVALSMLDESTFYPSNLSVEKQQDLQTQFDHVVALSECEYELPPQLELRSGGLNAFALPGGTVVLLDELVEALGDSLAVDAVLLHELAHLCYRDSLYGVANASLYETFATLIAGDGISESLSGVAVEAITSRYSRDQESRADRFATYHLQRHYGTTGPMFDVLRVLESHSAGSSMQWLSSHPEIGERMESVITPPETLDL